jgi:hypothetical protein
MTMEQRCLFLCMSALPKDYIIDLQQDVFCAPVDNVYCAARVTRMPGDCVDGPLSLKEFRLALAVHQVSAFVACRSGFVLAFLFAASLFCDERSCFRCTLFLMYSIHLRFSSHFAIAVHVKLRLSSRLRECRTPQPVTGGQTSSRQRQ